MSEINFYENLKCKQIGIQLLFKNYSYVNCIITNNENDKITYYLSKDILLLLLVYLDSLHQYKMKFIDAIIFLLANYQLIKVNLLIVGQISSHFSLFQKQKSV